MIKKIWNHFLKKEPIHNDNWCDILISLKPNKEIDLSIVVNSDLLKKPSSSFEQDCSEFLHIINSGKLKHQIFSILLEQSKDENCRIVLENILLYLIMLEQKEKNITENDDSSFIQPSKVFYKYVNTNT